MRLAFLCTSLEPGKDGVGDYARGFGLELQHLGHEVRLVALNDKFTTSVVDGEQVVGGKAVRTLRLPASSPWEARIEQARSFLDSFQPGWVSLQFVSYGYHRKGFIFGLAQRLKPLFDGRRLHMMFHEVWLGDVHDVGWKLRLTGFVQRFFIRDFVRRSRPDVIHTSNHTLQSILASRGIRSEVIPLFGAIPVCDDPPTGWIEDELRRSAGPGYVRDAFWCFGIFGGLYKSWPPEPLMGLILTAAEQAGKRIALIAVGRIGEGEALWDRMSRDYAGRIVFVRLGEQPAARVSEVLSALDYGIATTPWLILGKSSTVASMIEHGLPVIVNRDDVRFHVPARGPEDPLLTRCDEGLVARLVAGISKGERGPRRGVVVREFLRALQDAGRRLMG